MDTLTHTFFGLALYGAVNKKNMTREEKQALLFTAVVGSQIPDSDVISSWWDTAGRYQMWHRGLTHSLFLVPVWSALIALIARWIWGAKGWLFFGLGTLAVFIHDTSDLFNAWGTGYLEPVSTVRITFGTIPIVDLVMWAIMLAGWLWARFRVHRRERGHAFRVYRVVWLLLVLHVAIQSAQGSMLYKQAHAAYEQVALSADFVPGVFTVIGKTGDRVELTKGSLWTGLRHVTDLVSSEGADLEQLFTVNPAARTLVEWSPFVVIVDDDERLGVYDPRFYRNGQSFLFEYMAKQGR
ncbi:inner membrane protein [Paenibacillus sp. UNCCL117]|uniref:metal-dependent hydrolase n=1 Tax=unclassified Paenibacillus TaxID=185978 RepID=UPI000887EE4E|nr:MULTISPECIES: metal-dependent hydrolase [unclassified Paenibacillus]SDD62318.1 inner membrane protein [Paenibacillus sp. cl123]SFW67628.1 inner membrane protein [Paenibacillus sp. UNCCL117]